MKESQEEDKPAAQNQQKQNLFKLLDDKYKWLASEETRASNRKNSEHEHDEEFRKQHQKYIQAKLKRKQEELFTKKSKFGDSSSEDDQLPQMMMAANLAQGIEEKSEKQHHSEKRSEPELSSGRKKSQKRSKSPVKLINNPVNIKQNELYEYVDAMLLSKKGNNIQISQTIIFQEKVLALPGIEYSYYDINKVKLIFQHVGENCCKVKVSYKNQEFFMAASPFIQYKKKCSPLYFILAKFINEKLSMMGKKLYPQESINLKGIPQMILKNSDFCGKLLKKSQFLGKWNQRFVVINKDGLYYYKKLTDLGSFLIPRATLSEIWSRFEVEQNMIVIKLMYHGSKVQFGIPICDFISTNNWLYHLYGLAFKIQQK